MHQPTFAIHICYDMMIIDEWRWKLALFLWVLLSLCAATCQHYRSSGISSTLCLISNTDETWNLCDVIKNLLYSLLCCRCDDAQAFHNFRICLRMLCLVGGQWMWVENELKFHLHRHHVHQTFSIDMSKYFEYTMMIDVGNSTRHSAAVDNSKMDFCGRMNELKLSETQCSAFIVE